MTSEAPQQAPLDSQPLPSAAGEQYRRETKDCKARVMVFAHQGAPGQPGHRWAVPLDPCCKAKCNCPACVNKATKKQARRVNQIYDRIRDVSGKKVGMLAIVLTLPKQLWSDDKELILKIRRAGRDVLNRWVCSMNGIQLEQRNKAGWTLAGVDVLHPEGDEDHGTWKPHIHAQLPAVAWWKPAGELDDRPSWKPLRLKATEDELWWLRVLWGQALVELGWNVRSTIDGVKQLWKCNVHYHWFSGAAGAESRAKREHRVRYDFRHWPGYDGRIRKAQWWGFAAPARQPKAGIQKIKQDDQVHQADDSEDMCSCPCCGAAAEWKADIGRDPDKLNRKRTREKTLDLVGAPSWVKKTRHVRYYQPPPLQLFIDWRH